MIGQDVREIVDGRLNASEATSGVADGLDEATAAVDGASDAAFRVALRTVTGQRGRAALTVAQVGAFVELGALDPEAVVTPGIFVDRVVEVP